MLKRFIYCSYVFSFILISSIVYSAPLEPGEWLKTWKICGPISLQHLDYGTDVTHLGGFEIDYLDKQGGEEKLDIDKKNSEFNWFQHTSDTEIINLRKNLADQLYACAYAYCKVESPEQKNYIFTCGTDDGGRVWLNGDQIWDSPLRGKTIPDEHRIAVNLRKGENTILFKVENHTGDWSFCARFLELNIKDFVTENKIFSITNKQNGQAILTYNQPLLDSVNLLDKIILKIYKSNKLTEPLKELVWKKEKNVNLLPGVQNYDEYVLKIECVLADGTPWATEIPFKAGPYIKHYLFKAGKTDYSIVIGKDASSSEQWAAQELQHWLKEISGVQFPVKFDNGKPGENEIIIGLNNHSRALLGDVQEPEKDDDTYTYQNVGSNLIIWGSRQRGTMYGVFSFLENELGFRWYSPKVTVIPEKEKYGFVKLNHSESPGIKVRNDFYHHAFNPEWAARNKVNGAMNYREQPGGVEPYWGVHTFNYFVPVSEFFEIHPEYFSLIDGKRISERTQLCLTNPDVLKIVKERMKNFMREHPEHLIYSLSQNDHYNPCQCEKCQAIVKEQGSEAGLMLWFVNQIAEEIEAEFPDKYIGTLAYQYTRKPPKTIRPRKNVVIRFCSIECCFVHDFKSCPQNASFLEDLEGWSKIADKLYVWDYVVNFHHYINPFPNFKVLQPNIQIFRDNNVMGIMEQAAYQGNGGEFAELRAYVISKLLWNPDCNVDAIINDFMYGYYGRSGQYVREYFDFLHNNIKPDIHMGIFAETEHPYFTKELITKAEKILNKAKAVADNKEIAHRVEVARLPIMYLKCCIDPLNAKYDGTYKRFCEIVERENIMYYSERGESERKTFHHRMDALK